MTTTSTIDPALAAEAEAAGISMPPQATTASKAERPEHVPEKFWDAETGAIRTDDLLKSYRELETARSKPEGDPENELGSDEGDPQGSEDAATQEARKAVEGIGVDFDALSQEFAKDGTLSDASYKALEDGGIPREIVDQYIQGVRVQAEQTLNTIYEAAGGRDAYTQMVEWAATADEVTPEDAEAFNEAVNGRNPNAARMAIAGLRARYDRANGSEPGRTISGGRGGQTTERFTSTQSVVEAMQDPRYAKDPAYRAKVQDKLSRSDILA